MNKIKLIQEGEGGKVHRLFVNGVDVSSGVKKAEIIIEGGKVFEVRITYGKSSVEIANEVKGIVLVDVCEDETE